MRLWWGSRRRSRRGKQEGRKEEEREGARQGWWALNQRRMPTDKRGGSMGTGKSPFYDQQGKDWLGKESLKDARFRVEGMWWRAGYAHVTVAPHRPLISFKAGRVTSADPWATWVWTAQVYWCAHFVSIINTTVLHDLRWVGFKDGKSQIQRNHTYRGPP